MCSRISIKGEPGRGLLSVYEGFERARLQLESVEFRGCDIWKTDACAPARPAQLGGCDLDRCASVIRQARRDERPVVVLIGAHSIKLGLSRYLIDLVERGFITHLATNGAGVIHDFELALHGGTSEDVAKWIKAGQFGLWKETGRLNDIISEAAQRGEGLGEAVGRVIEEEKFPHRDISICAAGWRCGVPITSHVSIGSDIIHGYPNCDGAALGKTSHTDFLIFAKAIEGLEGGVFLNIGSAVTGPEVYLKALSMPPKHRASRRSNDH